jgi:hypothetical protein
MFLLTVLLQSIALSFVLGTRTAHGQRPKSGREYCLRKLVCCNACVVRQTKLRPNVYCLFVTTCIIGVLHINLPIPVAAPSEAWICGRSLPGIMGSNPA